MHADFPGTGLFRTLAEQFGDLFFDRGLSSMNDLEAAVQDDPKAAARHRDLGRRLLQDAKPKMARAVYRRAVELDPGDALARVGLACALDALGMTQTAMDELQACVERRPGFRPALAAMEYCSEKLGDAGHSPEIHYGSEEVVGVG